MTKYTLRKWYDVIWFVDFEYREPEGGLPEIRCMVAREWFSGVSQFYWVDELLTMEHPPFETGERSLVVAYYAPAELKCFRVLGWRMPKRILDLFAEFRASCNGCEVGHGYSLLGALLHFGLPAMLASEKEDMRNLAMEDRRSRDYSKAERESLMRYCEQDVVALDQLLSAMSLDQDRFCQALFRGRYMAAISAMEIVGVPIDTDLFQRLKDAWSDIQTALIRTYDGLFGIFRDGHWSFERFEALLHRLDISWPRTESGRLATDDTTFRNMARQHPQVAELGALRDALGQMRLFTDLAIGTDGRNRTSLSPFRSKTGRNQPASSRFIFALSAWVRSLIRPEYGHALAYIDWSQQEFLIAAALSGDQSMLDAYESGDVYMTAAIMCGMAPAGATKQTHRKERELFKQIVLANNYGQGAMGMAEHIGCTVTEARHLQWLFRMSFRRYFEWTDEVLNATTLTGEYWTDFGWPLHVEQDEVNGRSIRNFPVQATGADILRVACCLATEAGIRVCCPVHDAVLIEANSDTIDEVSQEMSQIMRDSSEAVCGYRCRCDAQIFRFPERYIDVNRGLKFFTTVLQILGDANTLADIERQTNCN